VKEHVHDTWAPLAYVPELGDQTRPPGARTWIDDADARRLTAYRVLAAYIGNIRRYWLPTAQWDGRTENVDGYIRVQKSSAENWREYGDAGLLVDTARALILGEDQTVEFPKDTAPDDTSDAPADPIEAWVDQWATRERLTQKLLQGESDSVGLGDGVFVLAPDAAKKRPRLRVYNPGFYFPDTLTVVPGWQDDEFPPIVHIAWEEEGTDGHTWVVRSTWQMVQLDTPKPSPWGGDPMTWTCMFRKVRYRLDRLHDNATVYSKDLSRDAVVVQDWTDLGVDFVPVVHVPNTPEEWGSSVLLRVGQILDDIEGTDTDLATGAQTSTAPTFVTSGAPVAPLTGVPGQELGLPSGASAGWVDTSKNLTALTGYLDGLLDRIAVNTRLAQALLGRIQPNDVPSGYALQLGFHPARQLMREARTVRDEKYPLILRFAVRLAQANGWLASGQTPDMVITLGASLPADLAAAVATVKDLLPVHGISTQTAVRILVQAGLPIEDATAEVEAIRAESYDAAVKLFEATGNAAAAATMLGVPPVTTTGLTE
jgi:hypothetical protein